jgi:thymidine kinase
MAKLCFNYSAMNAGKSTSHLQVAHNYFERGMKTYLLTAALDDRSGEVGVISSRIGIERPASVFTSTTDLSAVLKNALQSDSFAAVLVDEAQWLSSDQVWQLARFVDDYNVPVLCYGIRTDFQGKLFPGSETLLAIADGLQEIRTICMCGKKATMIVRYDEFGKPVVAGPQNLVGGNDTYESFCREHWCELVGVI